MYMQLICLGMYCDSGRKCTASMTQRGRKERKCTYVLLHTFSHGD